MLIQNLLERCIIGINRLNRLYFKYLECNFTVLLIIAILIQYTSISATLTQKIIWSILINNVSSITGGSAEQPLQDPNGRAQNQSKPHLSNKTV